MIDHAPSRGRSHWRVFCVVVFLVLAFHANIYFRKYVEVKFVVTLTVLSLQVRSRVPQHLPQMHAYPGHAYDRPLEKFVGCCVLLIPGCDV